MLLCGTSIFAASPTTPFFSTEPAQKFIEPSVHLLGGGSSIAHNYKSVFPEIENLNTNMGALYGVGARATFGLRDFLGLTTEINVIGRHYNVDMSVIGEDKSGMGTVFVNSSNYVINIPVLVTLRFNVARSVRWNIDLGPYYSYGFAGQQHQEIYVGRLNELGQIVAERMEVKTDYYNSSATFQNSFRRGDIGVHVGTSLDFGPHFTIGGRIQTGLKNISYTPSGIKNPSVRNFNLAGCLGWRF